MDARFVKMCIRDSDMGVEAVQQIISEIDSGVNSKKCITFQPKLIVRDSTAEYGEK